MNTSASTCGNPLRQRAVKSTANIEKLRPTHSRFRGLRDLEATLSLVHGATIALLDDPPNLALAEELLGDAQRRLTARIERVRAREAA